MNDVGGRADQPGASILGRDDELQLIQRFVGDAGSARCLVLSGDSGIGKTTLWEEAVRLGRLRGYRVLLTRASQAEATILFAGLADLLHRISPSVLGGLPDPQRRALEVALRQADPAHGTPEPLAIAAALLQVVRLMADQEPLLIAVDDVQWLDPSSAQLLLFIARRLVNDNRNQVRFLLSRPAGRQSELERAMRHAGLVKVDVGALGFGAVSHLLGARLGLVLHRRVQREVYLASQGNPLFALELGRVLAERETADIGADLPIPDLLDDIFGERVRGLPDPVRLALLAADLSANVSLSELANFVDPLDVDEAVSAGMLVVDRSRVRPSHPLLGAAARMHSTARERREVHLHLASAVQDPTLQARHQAMATFGQDVDLAARLAAACAVAAERGASYEAEELAADALRLTPRSDGRYRERVLVLARRHIAVGDTPRASALLRDRLAEFPAGPDRARALLLLGEAVGGRSQEAHLSLALAEAGDDSALRAAVLTRRAMALAVYRVERLHEAEAWAQAAMRAFPSDRADLQEAAIAALAWIRILRGQPIDDLRGSGQPESPGLTLFERSLDRPLGVRLAFRGDLTRARAVFGQLLTMSEEAGDTRFGIGISVQLCELELRAGDPRAAERLLDELDGWNALAEIRIMTGRLRAMHAAVSGQASEAIRWADTVMHAQEDNRPGWDLLEGVRARGIAALLEDDWETAARLLTSVWDHTVDERIDDPGAFPVAADLVEALVLTSQATVADAVSERLLRLATDQCHPWGMVTAQRCAASLLLATEPDAAADALVEAAAAYASLGLAFDRARTLLFAGRGLRRAGKRAAARRVLTDAEAAFAAAGCDGWAAAARRELGHLSGRRPSGDDELTPSERRVAELAALGLANKEIAAQLFVSVNTIEAHLSHAYAKLHVRSRAELSRHSAGLTSVPAGQ